MSLLEFGGMEPRVAADSWVAENATLVGNVVVGPGASIWYGAVLRGDNAPIVVGAKTNVQDLCLLHGELGNPVTVGQCCTIGHRATLHGCIVGDLSLIGMGAIVLDGAKIGSNCVIGAGTLILAGAVIPDNSLVVGHPGRVVRELPPSQAAEHLRKAGEYVSKWRPQPQENGAA
jgi:carbonic anhydrase/acetyltransferase-like protein (isoleucine patch superfamily)